jgi:glycosyltransferase involved in cell wall biosynthesis
MVSRGNCFPAHLAIESFRRQTYSNRELVIVCAQQNSPLRALVADLDDPLIRYIEVSQRTLGELRNVSASEARGSLLCTWDDDDLYHPRRLELQAHDLGCTFAANFLSRVLIWWPSRRLLGIAGKRAWENSMLVRRECLPTYPSLPYREDTQVVDQLLKQHRISCSDRPELYCYVVHSGNTSDTAHFEYIFEKADWIYPDYESELCKLSTNLPLKWYADELLVVSDGKGDGLLKGPDDQPRISYHERTFGSEELSVDGVHFRSCVIDGTTLLYHGGRAPIFDDCEFLAGSFSFVGSAFNTYEFMRQLKRAGWLDDL